MSSIIFYPDSESQEILARIPAQKRNQFINEAIKSCREKAANPEEVSKITSVNLELVHLLGHNTDLTATTTDGDSVEFRASNNSHIASLQIDEALDVLQSLRPPITLDEVVEMLTALSS